jgi:hypothetical protein
MSRPALTQVISLVTSTRARADSDTVHSTTIEQDHSRVKHWYWQGHNACCALRVSVSFRVLMYMSEKTSVITSFGSSVVASEVVTGTTQDSKPAETHGVSRMVKYDKNAGCIAGLSKHSDADSDATPFHPY